MTGHPHLRLEQCEASEETAQDNSQTIRAADLEDGPGTALVPDLGGSVVVAVAAGSSREDLAALVLGLAGFGLLLAGRGGLDFSLLRVGGSAGVVLAAGGRAGVVAIALFDALVAPFLADEVWESEAVFGDVGALVVAAETSVGELLLCCEDGSARWTICSRSRSHRQRIASMMM